MGVGLGPDPLDARWVNPTYLSALFLQSSSSSIHSLHKLMDGVGSNVPQKKLPILTEILMIQNSRTMPDKSTEEQTGTLEWSVEKM
jgi:hypothetical protein